MNSDAPQWALEMSHTLGTIDGKLDSLQGAFNRHVSDDNEVEKRVAAVENHQSVQRGEAKVWGRLTVAAGSLLGALAGYIGGHHAS
jgi:hypothetical protein